MSRKWIIRLFWGYNAEIYSEVPCVGSQQEAWDEARKLARHYLQDRVVSRLQVLPMKMRLSAGITS